MFQKFRFIKCYYFFARITHNFARQFNNYYRWNATGLITKRRNLFLTSLAAGFSLHSTGILDEDFVELDSSSSNPFKHPEPIEGWEMVYSDERISVFRRKLIDKDIYEYRCIGSYPNISVEDFIRAQYDIEYRQKWDENIKSLEVIEEWAEKGLQIIRWETRYPYPMSPRLYIYVQRKSVDSTLKSVMVVSRAMDESEYPDKAPKKSAVRVNLYSSKLLVRAHDEMDKNGLDFVLIYHDDPKAPLPKKIYEYGVNFIGPKYLTEVHKAALKLAEQREETMEEQMKKMEEEKTKLDAEEEKLDEEEEEEQKMEGQNKTNFL